MHSWNTLIDTNPFLKWTRRMKLRTQEELWYNRIDPT